MAARWAPDNDEGLHAYLVTKSSWGRKWDRIEYAASLTTAKAQYGWIREQHTSINVRRATHADTAVNGDH